MSIKHLMSAGILAIVGLLAFSGLQAISDLGGWGPSAKTVRVLQSPAHDTTVVALEGILWYASAVLASGAGILTGLVVGIARRPRTTRLTVVVATVLWSLPIIVLYSSAPLQMMVGIVSFCFTLAGALAFGGMLSLEAERR
ncbi:MAG: hypothetical protein ACSLFQ_13785 [Thermoanaerobaculia bacterium]